MKRGVMTLPETKNGARCMLPLTGHALALMHAHTKMRRIATRRVFPSYCTQHWRYAAPIQRLKHYRESMPAHRTLHWVHLARIALAPYCIPKCDGEPCKSGLDL